MKTKSLKLFTTAFAVLLVFLATTSLRAGTIEEVALPSTGTDPATGLNTNKTYLCCFDFGNYSSPPASINSVLFTHFNLVANNSIGTTNIVDPNYGGGLTLASGPNTPGVEYGTNLLAESNDSPSGQADGNTELMLEDMIYAGGGNADNTNNYITLNFTGLSIGTNYSLFIYGRQWASGEASPRSCDVSFNGDGTNTFYSGNPFNEDAGGAWYFEYDFTATATNVVAAFTNESGVENDPALIYGAALQNDSAPTAPSIPEPPTPALVDGSVVFSVTAQGSAPLAYQWYFNTVSNYSGATMETDGDGVSGSTTSNLTITALTDYYFVVVTNDYGSATSIVAEVASPLTVTSAGEPIWNPTNSQTNIVVIFSGALDPVTSTTVGNYSLSGGSGASVLSAALEGSNEVVLTTSLLNPQDQYTLTVSGVEDYLGITLSPSPTNIVVGLYPSLALWVKASTITSADLDGSGGVYSWSDLSGNGNTLMGYDQAPYDPLLATNALGQPVVRFEATNESIMYANPSMSLAITNNSCNISILAVVNFATALAEGSTNGFICGKDNAAGTIAAPYEYDVLNTNQGAVLYSGNGTSDGQFSATNVPSVGLQHVLAVTMAGGTVSHFLDGISSGTGVLNGGYIVANSSDAGQPLYIGTRGDQIERLSGDISELIIVGSALSAYDLASMNNYLGTEYNLPIGTNSYPAITQEPVASTNVNIGGTLTVPAAASGTPAVALQWYDTNNVAIAGQTSATLVISDDQTSDTYYLVATNIYGSVTSSVVAVTVNSGLTASLEPSTTNAFEGQGVTLTVAASGVMPLYYQWYQNGALIPNATNASYVATATLASVPYTCVVTNAAGGTTGVNGYSSVTAGPETVVGLVVSLEWRGAAPGDPGNWDTSANTNWFDTIHLVNSPFYTGAAVTFDDTGVTNVVNIPGTVQPGPVTISANNTNYIFIGPGGISGTNGLTVSGSATTTIQTTNSYTGVTTFSNGIVSVGFLTNGGFNSPIGAASAGSSNLVFGGGQLQYTGPSVSINRGLTLNANGGTLAVSSATATLTLTNAAIAGPGALTVSGSGTLVFGTNTANTYGGTTINSGATLNVGAGATLGVGGITNNGTLLFSSGVNVVMTNITGSGVLTNGGGATLWLGGSNSFTGDINIGTTNKAISTLYITNTYALNGTPQLRLTGIATTTAYLANNSATPNTTSINIPASVSLLEVGANGTVNRAQLENVGGGTDYWNGPISLAGDGTAGETLYIGEYTNGSLQNPPSGTVIYNGNITAPLAVSGTADFVGNFGLEGNSVEGLGNGEGIINGTVTLNTNDEVEVISGFWGLNSSGNTCGFVFFNGGALQWGVNNALPVNAPWRFGNVVLDLNGYNQEIYWMTNATGSTDGIITNSNPNTLSTLTYDNPGLYLYSGPNNANGMANNIFDQYNGAIGGYLALNVAGGTLYLGNTGINPGIVLTYTGPTTVSGGTLTLANTATIPNTPSITLAGGTTLNVASLRNTNSVNLFTNIFPLGAAQTLSNSSSTATLTGSIYAAGTVSLTYASGTPSFTVTGGALTLSSTTRFNVNNTGSALAAGSYLLIANGTGGSVAGTVPSVTVSGGGVMANLAPSLSISNSDLYLVVAMPSIPTSPTNMVFSVSSGNLTLSWPTNYTGWTLQAQTNSVSVGISTNWVNVSGSTTTNQVVIPINLTNGCVFYRLMYNP